VVSDATRRGQHQQSGEQEAADSEHAAKEEGIVTPQHAKHQDRHRDHGQRDFR
jgi:hypothetical protein